MTLPLRAAAALTSLAALAAPILVTAPAHAAAENGRVYGSASLYAASSCTRTPAVPYDSGAVITDNGGWVSRSFSASTTVRTSGGADEARLAASGSVRARVTPLVGGPARFDASISATASRTALASTNTCSSSASGGPGVDFEFTIATPQWLTVGGTTSGGRGSLTILVQPESSSYNGAGGVALAGRSTGSSRTYLAPGRYYLEAAASVRAASGTDSEHIAGSLFATWTPVGSATGRASGAAARLVTLGGRQDCARGTLTAGLSRRLAKKATKVTFSVNGRTRGSLKGRQLRRSDVLLTGLPATSPVTVRAVVKQKRGPRLTVSRSYVACR